MKPEVFVGIASIKDRQASLREALDSLIPQVDHIVVFLNYNGRPVWCEEYAPKVVFIEIDDRPDLGDGHKYWMYQWLRSEDLYFFTCDDDMIYPPDYVATMIAAIERYDRRAVIALHGWDARPNQESYHRHRAAWYHYSSDLATDTPAHVLGTCTAAWHTSIIPDLTLAEFERPNMCDLWFARHCNERNIPRIVIAHRGDYITNSKKYRVKNSIWSTYSSDRNREKFHTEVLNAIQWNHGTIIEPA
jgi:hypothetical protein